MADRRRTFAPVVLVGVAAAGLTALAGHRPMLAVPEGALDANAALTAVGDATYVEFPLVGALALVVLACWGVLLVTRGLVRRMVAALAMLASLGALVVVLVGGLVRRDDAAADLADRLGSPSGFALPLDPTAWFWCALLGASVATAAGAVAVALAPTWPEMGRRYDAPAAARSGAAATDSRTPAEERSSLDIWKSLDEGDDPTA